MKKLIMIAAMAVFGLSSAQEGFKLGAHIGVPGIKIKSWGEK